MVTPLFSPDPEAAQPELLKMIIPAENIMPATKADETILTLLMTYDVCDIDPRLKPFVVFLKSPYCIPAIPQSQQHKQVPRDSVGMIAQHHCAGRMPALPGKRTQHGKRS
jgi:hypothetical protein